MGTANDPKSRRALVVKAPGNNQIKLNARLM
jgi:hypothetical protein